MGVGVEHGGKTHGVVVFQKFKHQHLVEELEFNLSSTLRLGFGSAISTVKGIYGEHNWETPEKNKHFLGSIILN